MEAAGVLTINTKSLSCKATTSSQLGATTCSAWILPFIRSFILIISHSEFTSGHRAVDPVTVKRQRQNLWWWEWWHIKLELQEESCAYWMKKFRLCWAWVTCKTWTENTASTFSHVNRLISLVLISHWGWGGNTNCNRNCNNWGNISGPMISGSRGLRALAMTMGILQSRWGVSVFRSVFSRSSELIWVSKGKTEPACVSDR